MAAAQRSYPLALRWRKSGMISLEAVPSWLRNFAPMSRKWTCSPSAASLNRAVASATWLRSGPMVFHRAGRCRGGGFWRRDFFAQGGDDGLDAIGGLLRVGRVVADVVGPDHDDDDFGGEADQFAVGEPPEDVFGAVAAEPEVGGLERGEVFFPGGLAFPPLSDGIAEEGEVHASGLGDVRRSWRGVRPTIPRHRGEPAWWPHGWASQQTRMRRAGRSRPGATVISWDEGTRGCLRAKDKE